MYQMMYAENLITNLTSKPQKVRRMNLNALCIIFSDERKGPNTLTKRVKELEISGIIQAIQTLIMLKSVRILRRMLKMIGNELFH